MRLRRIALAIALLVFGAVPVALAADPFGPPEVVDPAARPQSGSLFGEQAPVLGVDGDGRPLYASYARDKSGNDQMAVYERCGTTWQRTLLGTPAKNYFGTGLRVGRDGTAMAVWRVQGPNSVTHASAVRPPGGAWGAPQTIVTDPDVLNVRFALNDAGAAVAVWADASPGGIWASFRPAGGAWSAPEKVVDPMLQHDVAIGANGDVVLVFQGPTPGYVFSRYHPAGGSWGATTEVLKNTFQNTIKDLMVAFDGGGRTVAMATFNEPPTDALRVNAGANGGWGATDQRLDDNEPDTDQFRFRGGQALVRHPAGIVAAWQRRPSSGSVTETVVSRFDGTGWETPHPFAVGEAAVAVNGAGEILVAGSTGSNPEIHAAIAASMTAAWPALARVSPAGTAADQFRDPVAAGGGNAFYLGWGVHGAGNDGTEMISTAPTGTCGAAATATATPSASPNPLPIPPPAATPSPTPAPKPPAGPSAINDFTTLPAASKCVRGRKLTVRFKKPPKGYVVKAVTVKVNARKVATVKGKRLKRPLYLRRLPKGTFTVTVSITLAKGKGLTEKRRYTACG